MSSDKVLPITLVTTLVIAAFIWQLNDSLLDSSQPSEHHSRHSDAPDKNMPETDNHKPNSVNNDQFNTKKSVINSNEEPPTVQRTQSENTPLIGFEKHVYSTPQSLTDTFINTESHVNKRAIETLFKNNYFLTFVEKLSEMEFDESSAQRRELLSSELYEQLGSIAYSEKMACSGKVCALSFKYSSDIPKETFSEIANFSENYSFINYTDSGNNETTLSAIFIETEDASNMVLTEF